jgi:hypothetical protein
VRDAGPLTTLSRKRNEEFGWSCTPVKIQRPQTWNPRLEREGWRFRGQHQCGGMHAEISSDHYALGVRARRARLVAKQGRHSFLPGKDWIMS